MTEIHDPHGKLLEEMRKLTDCIQYTATVSATSSVVEWDMSYEDMVTDMNTAIDTCQRILNMNLGYDNNE